jgi:polyhydroxyalkanoate synthase
MSNKKNNEKQIFEKEDDNLTQLFHEIMEKSLKIVNICLQPKDALHDTIFFNQLLSFSNTFQVLLKKLLTDPAKLSQLQLTYSQDYFLLCQKTMQDYWLGQTSTPIFQANERDKRFQNPIWQEHPIFHFFQQLYLLIVKHLLNLTEELQGLDKETALKINFFIRQWSDAMAPSNFIFTNPDVLNKISESGGQTLLKGMNNMLSDLETGSTLLNMTLTDLTAFDVGRNIAITPGKIIFQNALMQLIQYQPATKQVYQIPLIIIPPWINKYYILDLSERNSYVKWIVDQGYSVFLISWVNPDSNYAQVDFQDYLIDALLPAIEVVKKAAKVSQINALGFCIGGTLLATALAYLTEKKENPINCATYLTTLLDFSEPGDIGAFVGQDQLKILEAEVAKRGYLSGRVLTMIFNLLRPNDLIWSYYIKNYLQGEDHLAIDLLFWNADATNLPAKMIVTFLRELYLNNRLKVAGGLTINGVPICIASIKNPVYFFSTVNDHIAPWKSTYMGTAMHSGPVTFVLGDAGHVAGIVNPPSKQKYGYRTNEVLAKNPEDWLKAAEHHPDSWWIHWEKWLRTYSGELISARQFNDKEFRPIEDAPGSYVRKRIDQM